MSLKRNAKIDTPESLKTQMTELSHQTDVLKETIAQLKAQLDAAFDKHKTRPIAANNALTQSLVSHNGFAVNTDVAGRASLQPQNTMGDMTREETSNVQMTQAEFVIDCRRTVQEHIERLHRFNEMRDFGCLLITKLATDQGCTMAEVMERFGVTADD